MVGCVVVVGVVVVGVVIVVRDRLDAVLRHLSLWVVRSSSISERRGLGLRLLCMCVGGGVHR